MAESQNGWPGLAADSSKLFTWTIPSRGTDGPPRRLRLRNGSAGYLLICLALWFDDKIEDVEKGILNDWGYAYRPVRGYETLSNHASGTAIDLNSNEHWLGEENTFTFEQERMIRKRVNDYFDGAIRWGGEYQGRKDEMHFEIDAGLSYVEKVARRIMDTKRGKMVLEANPGQKAVILS